MLNRKIVNDLILFIVDSNSLYLLECPSILGFLEQSTQNQQFAKVQKLAIQVLQIQPKLVLVHLYQGQTDELLMVPW